eukprot:TRINITY_DN16212_c0_g1_i2.p2 TRINITY_DN16212_c0_g1~~TRINITY_DN16212_c0_g1_i2.p2  ORF type:complete len:123 (-),score=4.30 TRINITY_DN16212_c0_g1_i2:89-457(-)
MSSRLSVFSTLNICFTSPLLPLTSKMRSPVCMTEAGFALFHSPNSPSSSTAVTTMSAVFLAASLTGEERRTPSLARPFSATRRAWRLVPCRRGNVGLHDQLLVGRWFHRPLSLQLQVINLIP